MEMMWIFHTKLRVCTETTTVIKTSWGEGDIDRNKSSSKDQSHPGCESNSNPSDANGTTGTGGSSTDLSTSGSTTSNANSNSTSTKAHKVERRESARLASGASKFLRSLRSHHKESKDQINVIALKEIDSDHCLSPEGKGQGYNTTGNRNSTSGVKLPERSQSFQEKRLLVVTSKSTGEATGGGGPNGHVKVKHSRAQSFVCNSQPSHGYLKHQQNYSNQGTQLFNKKQQQLQQLQQQQQQQQQNIYSTPQNINGLPPPPPGPPGRTLIKPCETIYENLEVILEQNNLNKNSRVSTASTVTEESKNSSETQSKKTEPEGPNPIQSGNMTIFEKDRDRRPSRKLTKDSGYETNYSDYMNIEMLTSSTDSVDSPTLSKEFVRSQQQQQQDVYSSHGEHARGGGVRSTASAGVTSSKSSQDKERAMTTSSATTNVINANTNSSKNGTVTNTTTTTNNNDGNTPKEYNNGFQQQPNSHKNGDQVGDGNDFGHLSDTSQGKIAISGMHEMMTNRKLRRSISEVPSERMIFSKSQPKKVDASRTVYSSVGNGLSIWNLEKPPTAALSKSGSAQALYQSSSAYGIYQPIHNRGSSTLAASSSLPKASAYPSVYSTLPRNHTSGTTTNEGQYQSYYQIGAKSTPSLKHAVSHEQSQLEGPSSTGGLTPINKSSSNNPVYQSVPSLSPARSTPNLGSSLGKLQIHPHQQQPAYRQPPVYQPGVNSLGRIYQSPASIKQTQLQNTGAYHTLGGTPTKACSTENVKAIDKLERLPNENLYESRKLSISSTSSSSTTCGDGSQTSGTTGSTNSPNNCASQNTSQSQNPQCNSSSNSNNNPSSSPPSVAQGSTAMSNGIGSVANGGGSWIQSDSPSNLNNSNSNNNNNSAPTRDSSSLKQIRYGPGHEKYPSWPIPATSAAEVDPAGEANTNKLISNSGSARSKSWTEQTDYPKEKVPSYARPYMKRMNQAYTQQLKTVMEKCESYNNPDKSLKGGKRGQHNGYPGSGGGILPPPLGYRDVYSQSGHPYSQQYGQGQQSVNSNNKCTSPVSGADKEYNIPSPPERDVKPLTQEDVELYSKKYEEMMSQYAHSEGYHSYISSECSSYVSSGTPFLDLLRRESGELNQQFWSQGEPMDPNDPLFGVGMSHLTASGRESVTTVVTNSSSNSSGTETLKWHGSASDISLASGSVGNGSNSGHSHGGHNHNSIRMWEQQNSQQQQNIAHSAKVPMPQKLHPETVPVHHFENQQQIQNGIRQMKNKLESHSTSPTKSWSSTPSSSDSSSSREINLKKFPLNTYTRPSNLPIEKPQSTPEKVAKMMPPPVPPPTTTKDSPLPSANNSGLPPPVPSTPAVTTPTSGSKPTMSQPSSTSPIIDTSKPPSVAERIWELEQKQSSTSSSTSSATSSPKTSQNQTSSTAITTTLTQSEKFVKSSSLNNLREKSQPLTSLNATCPLQQGQSNSNLSSGSSNINKKASSPDVEQTTNNKSVTTPTSGTDSYKNLWNGYSSDTSSASTSTTTNNNNNASGSSNSGGVKSSPSQQQNQQGTTNNNSTSVNRVTDSPINNLPSSFSQISYSYLDPEKKHKVADMTLKAIQKKALLSYYERHTGKSSSSSVSSSDSGSSMSSITSTSTTTTSSKCQSQSLHQQQSSSSSLASSTSPPKHGNGVGGNTGAESLMSSTSGNNALLEKDSPFPGKSNRLTLSLPRDIDRVKESSTGDLGGNSGFSDVLKSSGLKGNNNNNNSNNSSTSRLSSHTSNNNSTSNTSATNHSLSSSSIKNKLLPPTPTSSSSPAKSHETNQVDKGEFGSSTGEDPTGSSNNSGESARMAYMSKYLPHLVNRDTTSNWNGMKSSSSTGVGGASNNTNTNSSTSTMGLPPNSSSAVTMEPAPVPPERPPKKPHLRNLSQQSPDDGKESSPPPPLPRAPIRPPPPHHLSGAISSTIATSGPVIANIVTGAPPVPSKPVVAVPISAGVAVARCPSPELPPPPPPIAEEEVEVIHNDEPLPPPPTLTEVSNCLGARSRSVSGLSSYLHKDSYLAQRKERTLGYEGRYRRTLSPSGLGSNNKSGEPVSMGSTKPMSNATSTGKLDTTLTPSAWEKYHNIRPPSTTVIFTSHEIAKSPVSPPFHRSISCDSNLFNNKTGFTQSTIPPPVAQVAPLRGSSDAYSYNQIGSQSSLEKVEPFLPQSSSSGSSASSSSQSLTYCSSPVAREEMNNDYHHHSTNHHNVNNHHNHHHNHREKNPSLSSGGNDHFNSNSNNYEKNHKGLALADAECQSSPDFMTVTTTTSTTTPTAKGPMSSLPSVMVSPLQYSNGNDRCENNKENIPFSAQNSQLSPGNVKKSEVSLRVNCTSDASSQTDVSQPDKQQQSNQHQQSQQDNRMRLEQGEYHRTIATETASLDENMSRSSSASSSSSGGSSSSGSCSSSGSGSSTTASSCSSSFDDSSSNKGTHLSIISSYTGRQKTQEELECEELSRHLIKHLPQGDKLQQILVPLPEHKTTADYMEGLFQLELKLKPEKQEKETNTSARSSPDLLQSLPKKEGGIGSSGGSSPVMMVTNEKLPQPPSPLPNGESIINNTPDFNGESIKRCNGHAPLPADSAYFTTSECKAKFLTQYVKDMNKNDSAISRSQDSQELNQQKEMLVSRISRKLEILRTEHLEIREEIQSNEQLGQQVVERVKLSAKRNEFDKFKLHVEEIEKITSLLLGLSGRLARAENALMGLAENSNPQEKKILEGKRDKLREQLDEAKILKENIDRRSAQVSSFLQKYLTVEDYADYHHFVKMKAKLIIDAREIDDKIKLGEEQMVALKETLHSL